MGFDPMNSGFALAGDSTQVRQLRMPDPGVDRLSRSEFGSQGREERPCKLLFIQGNLPIPVGHVVVHAPF